MATVRLGSPEDASAICEVYASDETQWYRWSPDGTKIPASYGDLTIHERWLNGGPWLDPGFCRTHLEQVLAAGAWPLVAEEDGHVVGEMEVIVGPDPVWGKVAHIDVLQVHRAFQRKGAGRALVLEGLARAVRAGCNMYTVCPEETAVGFYAKCGLSREIARQREYTLPVNAASGSNAPSVEPGPLTSFDPLRTTPILLGRFQTSYAEWIKGRWALVETEGRILQEEGAVPILGAYYRLWRHPPRRLSATLNAWAPNPVRLRDLLQTMAGRARELGYDTLVTTVDLQDISRIEDLGGTFGKESLLLGESLAPHPS